jgi:UDP:flavonoid glycosyltransferase YjiC (YdhE family)
MRVLIMAVGSTGDVAPYTGLGTRLREAGHHVAIAAAEPFAGMIRAAGLEFRALPGDPRAQQRTEENQRWQHGGGGVTGGARLVRLLSEQMAELGIAMIGAARQGADVILLSGPAYLVGADVAEGLGIPSIGVFAAPAHPTGDFPPVLGLPSLGRFGNRAAGKALFAGMSLTLSGATKRIRAELGLPPRSFAAGMRAQDAEGWPVLYGFSPTVVPRPSDWRTGLDVVGYFWPRTPDWRPPAELAGFLAAGAPPVFIGFGSMVPGDAAELSALVGGAVRRAGLRAVVQSGWAGLRGPGPDVLTIGEAPHEWLFPRMSAVVHHCGAGTTAAALRAGTPTVPVPVAADQPFWAARQAALGVSPAALPRGKLTAERLADALRTAVHTPSYRDRARQVAGMIGAEDGAGKVLAAVDELADR